MLRFFIVIFIVILLATIFGFGGSIATGAVSTAKVLFYVFVTLIVLSLLLGPTLFRKR